MKIKQFATVSVEEVAIAVFGEGHREALEDLCDILDENHTSDDVDVALILLKNFKSNLPCYGVDWWKFCKKYDHLVSDNSVDDRMHKVLEEMLAKAPTNLDLYLSLSG
jgi:hypothetical protein